VASDAVQDGGKKHEARQWRSGEELERRHEVNGTGGQPTRDGRRLFENRLVHVKALFEMGLVG
jgi:hypothetical protein